MSDVTRDPLALAMFAAWVNVPVDKLPPEMQGHTCEATMTAWKRVGEAAVAYLRAAAPVNATVIYVGVNDPGDTDTAANAQTWLDAAGFHLRVPPGVSLNGTIHLDGREPAFELCPARSSDV